MIRFVSLTFLALFLCVPVAAQPDGVEGLWEHYFSQKERTVYLDLRTRSIVVWSIDDSGQCMRYPGVAEWNGDRMQRLGQDWRVRLEDPDLHVSFPDTTVTYKRSTADPSSLCQREDI